MAIRPIAFDVPVFGSTEHSLSTQSIQQVDAVSTNLPGINLEVFQLKTFTKASGAGDANFF
jgi:hypothetical protein